MLDKVTILAALMAPLATAILVMLIKNPRVVARINLLGATVTSAVLLWIVRQVAATGRFQESLFLVDELSALFLLILGILAFTVSLFSVHYMEFERETGHITDKMVSRYYALLQLFIMSMIFALVVENLGMLWVAIEATTLVSALLVAYYSNRSSLEAAWKYVMVCSVGITLALLGTILLYYAQVQVSPAEVQPLSWLTLYAEAPHFNPALVKLAVGFLIIGYGTKAGLAPMHTWLPDAYSQAPSPISGVLSGALMSCAVYAMIRNLAIINQLPEVGGVAGQLLTAFGVFSIGIAVPFLLLQHNVKRLLAYSSVENTGLIVIGIGTGTPLGIYGALLHILNHAVGKSALFFITGLIVQQYRTKYIMRIKGILTATPLLGGLFILLFLAVSGLPPFGLFLSKLTIIQSLFSDGWELGILTLLLLGGVFAGMVYYMLRMVFGSPPALLEERPIPLGMKAAILLSLTLLLAAGFFVPDWLDALLRSAASIVTGRVK